MNNKNKEKKFRHTRIINAQKGLSLVELLVSITLGTFILAGVVTNFIGTKEADKTRAALSEMDANARAAINILRQTILHAGYPSINNVRLETAFYTPEDGVLTNKNCGAGISRDLYTPLWWQRTRDSGRTDVMTVVSLADNPCKPGVATCPGTANVNPAALVYYDCLGGGAKRDNPRVVSCSTDPDSGMEDPTEAKIFSTFWLRASNRTLYCKGSRGGAQPLVENMEYLQFLYGIKKADGTISYRRANDITASNEWGYVSSVQVAMLMRSSKDILKEPSDKIWYTLLDVRRRVATKDLRRLFRVYTTTINLENRNKGALL